MTREEIINDAIDKIVAALDMDTHGKYITDIAGSLLKCMILGTASIEDEDITPQASEYLNGIRKEICEATNKIWLEKQKKNLKVN